MIFIRLISCLLTLIVLSVSIARQARAQAAATYAVDLQTMHFSPSATGFFSTESADVMKHLGFNVGVIGNYANRPLMVDINYLDGTKRAHTAVGLRLDTELLASFALFNIAEIGVAVPFITQSGFDTDISDAVAEFNPSPNLRTFSLGDVRVIPKARIITLKQGLVSLALACPLIIPTGKQDYAHFEGLQFAPTLIVSTRFLSRFRAALNVGYLKRNAADALTLRIGDELFGKLALAMRLPTWRTMSMEIIGEVLVRTPPSGNAFKRITAQQASQVGSALEIDAGVKTWIAGITAVTVGAGVSLWPGYMTPLPRVFLGFSYSNSPPFFDKDGDGITDDVDACVDAPEDKDSFEDSDGCPDADNDGDKILDNADKCKNEAEDIDNFEDEDGCPERDNDGDGMPDSQDWCPTRAEDFDNFEDTDGCPDDDTDHDGLADNIDKCPNEPEVYNGIRDDDGCKDAGTSFVRVTGTKVEVNQTVYFQPNSAILAPKSYRLLNQVASVISNYKNIHRIRIEGHTDDRGSAKRNLSLSAERATSVMNYLISRGIAPSRLVAEGFGMTRPIQSNKTKKGRNANRRVEFVIIEQDAATPTEPSGAKSRPEEPKGAAVEPQPAAPASPAAATPPAPAPPKAKPTLPKGKAKPKAR